MDSQQHIIMANKFQCVLEPDTLNERGKAIGFAKRHRLITPFRLALSIMASMASKQVETLADLHRHFNDFWQLQSSYKAVYNQLLKPTAAELFRASLSHMMSTLTMKVLGFEAGTAFSEFKRIVIQDGSSFAIHKALAHVYPGRFNAVKPAAVELHCTLDLLQDAPITISLSPDTDSERAYLPEPAGLKGDLLLSDRGYLDLTYLRDVNRHGGYFIFRGKTDLNPRVISAFREDGKPIPSSTDRDLKAIVSKLPKQQRAELEVEWRIEGEPFRLRLVISWNPKTKSFCYLLTNLPQGQYTIEMVCL